MIMIEKDMRLLLQDLCARLPYGVKGNFLNEDGTLSNDELLRKIKICYRHLDTVSGGEGMVITGEIKPYLFPLSSMTDEQYKTYWALEHSGNMEHLSIPALDWLNAHHFDYRGLIEKGLAIDATGLNIY